MPAIRERWAGRQAEALKHLILLLVLGGAVPAARADDMAGQQPHQADPGPGEFLMRHVPAGGELGILFRNYAEYLGSEGSNSRRAWVQSAKLDYVSGYTAGTVGVGADLSLFAAVKLDGGRGAGNMVHLDRNNEGQGQTGWAYANSYAVKMKAHGMVLKYGLLQLENPFLESKDNHSSPPTFRGLSLAGKVSGPLFLELGSFDAVNARGRTDIAPLSTSYAGVRFERVSYAGGKWAYAQGGELALYASQASDVWNQAYGSFSQVIRKSAGHAWSAGASLYRTRSQGSELQGAIDNTAYSVTSTIEQGSSSLTLSFQRIAGNQFQDFVQEVIGLRLDNGMFSDYNAPQEKSIGMRYNVDPFLGVPGLQTMWWGTAGRIAGKGNGARARTVPALPGDELYWKNGQPIHGRHYELGLRASYTLPRERSRHPVNISFIAVTHRGSAYTPDPDGLEYRLFVEVPIRLF